MKISIMFKYLLITMLSLFLFFSIFGIINLIQPKSMVLHAQSYNNLKEKALQSYYSGNLRQSRNYYHKLLQDQDRNQVEEKLDILQNLVLINKKLGNINKVVNYYREMLTLDSRNLNIIYDYGIVLYQYGSYRQAEIVLKNVLESDNNDFSDRKNSLLCYYLGQSLSRQQEFEIALTYFNRGIKYDKDLTLNFTGKGEALTSLNKFNEAASSYKAALKKDFSLSYLYPKLAVLESKIGNMKNSYYYWNKSLITGHQTEQARARINEIEEEYPEFVEDEEKRKKEKRREIDWISVKPVTKADIPNLRIGIKNQLNYFVFKAGCPFQIITKQKNTVFRGKAQTEYKITYEDNEYIIYHNDNFIKNIEVSSPIRLSLTDNTKTFAVYNIEYGQGYFWAGSEDRQYRGTMELYPADKNSFNLINIINIEAYLYSVVPSEMPALWPMEALKAQTVAARSYSLKHRDRFADRGYDLCSTVACAVYKGVTGEHERARRAVRQTAGEVGIYNGRIIDAVFSSNSGGYTESSQDVWGNKIPYLQGTDTMKENKLKFPLAPSRLAKWLSEKPSSFSNSSYTGSNVFRWTKILTDEFLERNFNLNNFKNIEIGPRSRGGSIQNLTIVGSSKKVKISRDRIRGKLGGLKSNRFLVKRVYQDQEIVELILLGGGWGHNVGLDQTAAAGMAENDYNYKEILKYFYPGINIEKKY